VISAFDWIMANKVSRVVRSRPGIDWQHKKPTWFQRLTKSGSAKQRAPPTPGEFMAKMAMRHRARTWSSMLKVDI
jgi:hypothetical protein